MRPTRRWLAVAPLLAGCAGRGTVEDSGGLPDCPAPVTAPFTPVWTDELRLDVATAAFDGALALTGSDAGVSWSEAGSSRAAFWLNRGMTYTVEGQVRGARVELVQSLESGGTSEIAVWQGSADAASPIDTTFTVTQNGNAFALVVDADGPGELALRITGQQWADVPDVVAAAPVRLGFLMHVEEAPELVTDEANWRRRAAVIEALSAALAAHGASLTLQPGSTFVEGASTWDPAWFAAREAEGMTWSVHVHNEADGETALEKAVRTSLHDYRDAGLDVRDLNGGFSLGIWQRMAAAGIRSVTAFKNPETQLDLALPLVQPWRPADGTGADDESAFSTHDPDGPVIYLPGSGVREADHARFAAFAQARLSQVRQHARAGFVNTWYLMEHVDGFGPDVHDPDFDAYLSDGLAADIAAIDDGLTTVIDPLVADGQLTYSNPDAMRVAFEDWESGCALR